MGSTPASRRDIFRTIATTSYHGWPAYDTTPLYDRSSLGALEEDIRTVAAVWFAHCAHNSVDELVCELPLQYVDFRPHDRYSGPATYEMRPLVRAFLLKAVYGWDYETALIEYLDHHPEQPFRIDICNIWNLDLESSILESASIGRIGPKFFHYALVQ